MSKKPVLYKTLVIGIFILLIGMSVVSSTGIITEDYSLNKNFIESFNSPNSKLNCEHLGYVLSSGTNNNIYEFLLNDPNNLTCVCEGEYFTYSSTWSYNGYIYSSLYENGSLLVIDLESCEMWIIGGGGVNIMGLAYDPISGILYASSDNECLYKIDPYTGEQELVGSFSYSGGYMVGLAFDSEGILYGWDLMCDNVWIIDTETGEATLIGSLGININYACDGDFCKECDIFYLVIDNKLYYSDKKTGECELNDQFPDYVSVTGLAIPYDDTTPPKTTYTLDPPEPDGNNSWYVSNVNVTLTATDYLSGVKEIRYTINGGPEQVIPGDNGSFILSEDGDDILVIYWAVDNAGNVESPKNSFKIDIDQTPPDTCLCYEIVGGNWWRGWDYEFSLMGTDATSNVKITYYRINGDLWVIYTEPFILSGVGDEIIIEYYSVDYAGNVEDVKSTTIPRTRATYNTFLIQLFERFPLLEKLLNLLR